MLRGSELAAEGVGDVVGSLFAWSTKADQNWLGQEVAAPEGQLFGVADDSPHDALRELGNIGMPGNGRGRFGGCSAAEVDRALGAGRPIVAKTSAIAVIGLMAIAGPIAPSVASAPVNWFAHRGKLLAA